MPWFETSMPGIDAHYTLNPVEVDDIRPDIPLTYEEAGMIQREAKEHERGLLQ